MIKMKRKVLVIAGPTGVGKTACSILMAKQLHGEIINGDAMQVYQGLDIGTAKITQAEMDGVTHHLLDFLTIYDEYNIKIFQEKGRALIEAIAKQNALPIICGGTGLYIKSLLYDYTFQSEKRDEDFISFLQSLSNSQLYALLTHVDSEALTTIHYNNRQRMIRAIEMAHAGKKKSEIIAEQHHELLYDAFCIGLTMNRECLYERINQRVDQMMEAGLYEEVRNLAQKEPAIWKMQCFQSIGYKEWYAHFIEGASIEVCVDRIKKNSRSFAKRQFTWFNNQLPMRWYDVQNKDWEKQILKDVETWLND